MIKKLLIVALLLPVLCSSAPPAARIEITQQDPGAGRRWTSADVSVFGLWLGQSRKDAFEAMRNRSGELWPRTGHMIEPIGPCHTPRCWLTVLNLYTRASVNFDDEDAVSVMEVIGHGEQTSAISPATQAKGELGELLRSYSEGLRLKLFGEPERVVDDPPVDQNFITYYYDTRGISIRVQRATDEKGPYGPALVILCLYRPGGANCSR